MAQAPIKLACEQCAESFERPAKTVNFYARQGIARIKYCSRKCRKGSRLVYGAEEFPRQRSWRNLSH